VSRLRQILDKKLRFPGWRRYWTNAAVFVTLGLAGQGYRVWRGGDPFELWTTVGLTVFVILVGAFVWLSEVGLSGTGQSERR
jgi:hypothetical protein